METSREAGWTPLEDGHAVLLRYELLRHRLGDTAVEGPAGPPLEWPEEWGAWCLAEHRAVIAHHFAESERIALEERAS
jgi:hypothetical protein